MAGLSPSSWAREPVNSARSSHHIASNLSGSLTAVNADDLSGAVENAGAAASCNGALAHRLCTINCTKKASAVH
jgi:hypothetical protein